MVGSLNQLDPVEFEVSWNLLELQTSSSARRGQTTVTIDRLAADLSGPGDEEIMVTMEDGCVVAEISVRTRYRTGDGGQL